MSVSIVSRKACPAFLREWFAVKQALKEARLQTPVLTNRNGILRLHEVGKQARPGLMKHVRGEPHR